MEFLNFSTLKNYIVEKKKFRSSDKAVQALVKRFSELTDDTIDYAMKLAEADRRKTIMPRDMKKAAEDVVGKRNLAWQELLKEITAKNATQIGNISKGIQAYIRKER
jgi:histone H3/H4